jgi:endonuclease/exonuclease/phosphatase family metal-dependent hydrolase
MKLTNINIEGDRHYETVLPFLKRESPDVFCLQEVFELDLSILTHGMYQSVFLPITLKQRERGLEPFGIVLAVRNDHVIFDTKTYYYHDDSGQVREFHEEDKDTSVNPGVIVTDVTVDGIPFVVATTHFTWIPNGDTPTPWQRQDMERFLTYMGGQSPHVLTGDFNIPRNKNPLYNKLTEHYTDSVPSTYSSSLDRSIHRLGHNTETAHIFTDYMVDYLFTQEPYRATNVRLEFGISDHAAVVGEILRD